MHGLPPFSSACNGHLCHKEVLPVVNAGVPVTAASYSPVSFTQRSMKSDLKVTIVCIH
jgi:hypothetical protein